ncbi:MAG TPA: NUDIX pyrophosphatase [Candidatus Nitrosopolaris sp.]|nr:NUDIX pyrophosphatase [Candidatus Nitrosopolaris sp.]
MNIVTVFLEHNKKILILRRSQKAKTMKTKWGAISGYIEQEEPVERALIEIAEETGLTSERVTLLRIGEPLEAIESDVPKITWVVHPFLFSSNTDQIRINWEHDEYRWINPNEIKNLETVPRLRDAFDSLQV